MNANPDGRTKRPRVPKNAPGAVWLREGKSTSTRPQLSRERIVAVAVELLDGDGVEKLSMRRLAQRLDAHATSLYWHVATKEDVLDLALDAVFGELELPAAHSASWQDDVTMFMTRLRAVLLRHPWAAALASTRPLVGPQALRASEFTYSALRAGGFGGVDLSSAAASISHYVIGVASAEAVWQRRADEAATRSAMAAHLRERATEYPTLAEHFTVLVDDWDSHFQRGMRILLAGIEAQRPRE